LVLIDDDGSRLGQSLRLLRHLGATSRPRHDLRPSDADAAVRLVVVQADGMGKEDARRLRFLFPRARLVLRITVDGQQGVIAAFRAGIDDVIAHDAPDRDFVALVERHIAENQPSGHGDAAHDNDGLVGTSVAMRQVRDRLRSLARGDTTVLITGETGTGKEVAALLLHRASARRNAPLVALNCAAIPEALIEGELFGYERGAFSGALAAYPGKLKLADGGTLLLDEIGEFSLAAQAKVLRAIEAREFYRLGARRPTAFNVRIIAATNRDLQAEMRAGRFRTDLFYRIAVARVHLSPLRQRPGDVGVIARHLLAGMAASAPRALAIDDAAVARLAGHDWPGNVRELRNVLEAAVIAAQDGVIRAHDLPAGFDRVVLGPSPGGARDERARLIDVLRRSGGNKSLAAAELRCSRMTLYRRLARAGVPDGAWDTAPPAPPAGDLSYLR